MKCIINNLCQATTSAAATTAVTAIAAATITTSIATVTARTAIQQQQKCVHERK